MAVTGYGFAGPLFGAQWRSMARLLGKAVDGQVVEGMTIAPGAGVRQTVVGIGQAQAYGVFVDATTATTLTHDAQTSGTRRDYVVLRLTWSTGIALITIVKGQDSVGTTPQLAKTPGSVWEIPLATVDVDSTNGVFVVADIIARKPKPRNDPSLLLTATSFDYHTGQGYNAAPLSVATLNPGDPGWPYRFEAVAATLFATTGSGAGTVQVAVSGVATPFLLGRSDPLNTGVTTGHPARVQGYSDILTGSHGAVFSVQPRGLVAGDSLSMLQDSSTMFQLRQVPAV